MRPRADEVMQSIIATYDEHILPNVQGALPKSLALTVSNLLRHVALRMEREAPALIEDNAELRAVLAAIADYLATMPQVPDPLQRLAPALREAGVAVPANGYVGLVAISDEAQALRGLLDDALKALQQHRATLAASAGYADVRQRIRNYLANQLQRESQWIREAFTIERR